jgi:hypothetical protein
VGDYHLSWLLIVLAWKSSTLRGIHELEERLLLMRVNFPVEWRALLITETRVVVKRVCCPCRSSVDILKSRWFFILFPLGSSSTFLLVYRFFSWKLLEIF